MALIVPPGQDRAVPARRGSAPDRLADIGLDTRVESEAGVSNVAACVTSVIRLSGRVRSASGWCQVGWGGWFMSARTGTGPELELQMEEYCYAYFHYAEAGCAHC
ncbi:hypothetical protein NBRGN_009_00150 [Nocardia brasiliensis NBRC 14402]|nr:hypothetical protein NBRGN_009_00150 [Nocardia brasiliensis NBRC 14402]